MKFTFIIDENLSPEVAEVFREQGLNAYHVNQLKSHSKQRVIDDQLRSLSIQKGYVIITKDDDFVHSYVNRKVPEKLVFVYGLEKKESLIARLQALAIRLPDLLVSHDFIEITQDKVNFPFSI